MKNYTFCLLCGQYVPWARTDEDSIRWPIEFFVPPHYDKDGISICSNECQTPTGERCDLPEGVSPAIVFKKYRQLAFSANERSPMPPPTITPA